MPRRSLFNGCNLDGWIDRQGRPANWKVHEGYMEVTPGSGDIFTVERFHDFELSLEFWLPLMSKEGGQARANSGVYLQGLYEIQVLDSYQNETEPDRACGALYRVAAPTQNASLPPEHWQRYEIAFRAPRDGKPGRLTLDFNGVRVLDGVEFSAPTGGGLELVDREAGGPLLLQDHGSAVRYRDIRVEGVSPC